MTTGLQRPRASLLSLASSIAALAIASAPASGQGATAVATVTFEVREINEISLSGNPQPLVLVRSDGQGELEVVDAHTTWEITTNQQGRKLTALLDADLPTGLTLSISLDAPHGAISQGLVPLATTARDLVVDFESVRSSSLGVTYSLTATRDVQAVSRTSRLVTFTIVTGS